MRASLSLEGAHTFSARRSGVTSRHAFRLVRFHGKGSMRYANGSKYVGQFENGLPHGIGAIHDPVSGNSYRYIQVGETSPCLDRCFAIQVVTHLYSLAFLPVCICRGQWAYGRQHGKGTSSLGNGGKYMGSWFRGKCSGAGQFVDSNGANVKPLNDCRLWYVSNAEAVADTFQETCTTVPG